MKKYLINYSHGQFKDAQKINSYTGIKFGKFDDIIEYNYDFIDENFKNKNSHILNQNIGAGYWLWKPYIILKTLSMVNDNDVVFYSDSGVEFISSSTPLIDECLKNEMGFICFDIDPHPTGNPDVGQIKRDALILTDCDSSEYINTNARLASFMIIKNTKYNRNFIEKWLYHCCDERALTDIPNQLGENYDGYIAHRHDQAIFSVLSKKYGYNSYRDPSQWGNNFYELAQGNYPQIINHTRNKK